MSRSSPSPDRDDQLITHGEADDILARAAIVAGIATDLRGAVLARRLPSLAVDSSAP